MKYLYLLLLLVMVSCKTYTIPVDSFAAQFAEVDSSSLKQVRIVGAQNANYLANQIAAIECVDKQGDVVCLRNSPSLEVRFTYGDPQHRIIFYFDRVILQDGTIVGGRSRFIPSMLGRVPLEEVTKIEIQDGGKNYKYIDREVDSLR